MIEEIAIHGLGVIEDATLPLGPGFTALTGETGAGKTMVVQALGLLLGERADSGIARQDAGISVEGRWLVPDDDYVAQRAREAGGILDPVGAGEPPTGGTPGEGSDDEAGARAEVLVTRTVSASGRSKATIGGRAVPVGLLADIGTRLVAIHGQSDQLRLRSASAQRHALDGYGGAPIARAAEAYTLAYTTWQEHRSELATLTGERDTRQREAELLRDALERIERVDPLEGEDVRLAERVERLANLEELRTAAAAAREMLSSEDGEGRDVVGLMAQAQAGLERAGAHDAALNTIGETLRALGYQVADAAADLSSYLDGLDAGTAEELEQLQERQAALSALLRSFGPRLDDVLALAAEAPDRLAGLEGDDERIAELQRLHTVDEAALEESAEVLTRCRRAAAESLGAAVTAELAALAMPDARLVVEVRVRDGFTADGKDEVQMLLRPHRGAPPRPLGRGASGGELSRVMLALEVVVAEADPVPTLVFDEVDQGVGGAVAIEIGRRLARLAHHTQVIAVTHLAQVAAFATNHLTVVKDPGGTLTTSSIRRLEGAERVAEMTRLLSGLTGSATGAEHATELLQLAGAS
jgi:DNA repair protein RecN (Recombination protein N)